MLKTKPATSQRKTVLIQSEPIPIETDSEDGGKVYETLLWVDKYHPVSENELALHKRKLRDVRDWLQRAFETNKMSYSSHSGLKRSKRVKWDAGYVPVLQRFNEFLSSACRIPALAFAQGVNATEAEALAASSAMLLPSAQSLRRKVVLIEDWPQLGSPTSRASVQLALRMFLESRSSAYPMVLIISDVSDVHEVGGGAGREGMFNDAPVTLRTLIPPDIATVGRVTYNKRLDSMAPCENMLSPYLDSHRRNRLEIEPEALFGLFYEDANTFTTFLEQNCPVHYETVEQLVSAVSYFSDSDLLSASWENRRTLSPYVMSVAARGALFSHGVAQSSYNEVSVMDTKETVTDLDFDEFEFAGFTNSFKSPLKSQIPRELHITAATTSTARATGANTHGKAPVSATQHRPATFQALTKPEIFQCQKKAREHQATLHHTILRDWTQQYLKLFDESDYCVPSSNQLYISS
eukprot:jgi/Hompol1/464/HPOL_001768-RA